MGKSKKPRKILANLSFWLRGYIVVPNFLTSDECFSVRKYAESIYWPVGESNKPHGSYCSLVDLDKFDFQKCLFDRQINASRAVLMSATKEKYVDVGLRTLQLRMHSPIWHIDMQTFNNDFPLLARDKRFKVYKCGVYLQDELASGGGTIEIKQPFLGGGIKNFSYLANIRKNPSRILQICIKLLGLVSDSVQIRRKRLELKAGDLIIFNGSLKHRASQDIEKNCVLQDGKTGYFVDRSDEIGKIMLQWEFVKDHKISQQYIIHAQLKHGNSRDEN